MYSENRAKSCPKRCQISNISISLQEKDIAMHESNNIFRIGSGNDVGFWACAQTVGPKHRLTFHRSRNKCLKTTVYKHDNGYYYVMNNPSKTAKVSRNEWCNPPSHRSNVNVLLNNITFYDRWVIILRTIYQANTNYSDSIQITEYNTQYNNTIYRVPQKANPLN